jgi:hypothetical protein
MKFGFVRLMNYLSKVRDVAREQHLSFGIIYDGNPREPSGAEWLKHAEDHMALAEATLGKPDTAIFQTWHPYPRKLLPEQDADAFTHIINRYFRPRTVLTTSLLGGAVTGKLLTDKGQPVGNARIDLTAKAPSESGVMETLSGTGTVPPGTTAVVLSVRANEVGWPSSFDVRTMEFKIETKDGWSAVRAFQDDSAFAGWGGLGVPNRIILREGALCVNANGGQMLELNSPRIPLAGTGQPYTFSVRAQIPAAAENSGCFGVFFLNEVTELNRLIIPFRSPSTSVGTATTKADGCWSFSLPTEQEKMQIEVHYAGDDEHWPAQSAVVPR